MQILICIDDTDNLESRGTGHLAADLALMIEEKGWGIPSYITRHQLFVHPDIPYTSHNSAMAFSAAIDPDKKDEIILFAASFLEKESADGSDPGLCVVVADALHNLSDLISFGFTAKKEVLTKEAALALARNPGIHLSEHGGTGDGIIGAIAGIGLRLSGNDGRLRGKIQFPSETQPMSVAALCRHDWVDMVKTEEGMVLDSKAPVWFQDSVKTVLLDGKAILLAEPHPGQEGWRTLGRRQLKRY